MAETVMMLLDTDIGSDIDDALCLCYLLAEPRCRLLGVSTVTGQGQRRAMLADALCRAAGRRDVPIWSGAEQPLSGQRKQPSAPQAEVLARWEHREDFAAHEAVQNMRRVIRRHPGEVTLLSIGPLTNVGALFRLDDEAPRLLRRLVMMAGRFFSPGPPEWNAGGDLLATATVLAADVPEVRVYGLDVTMKCRLGAQAFRERFRGGPLDVVADMADVWFRQRNAVVFHDPLAACCVFAPDICTYRRGRVSIELRDADQAGRTALAKQRDGRHAVAEEVNVGRFFECYFRAVRAFRRAGSPPDKCDCGASREGPKGCHPT